MIIERVQGVWCPWSDEHRLDPARQYVAPPTAATKPSGLIDYFIYCQTCRNWARVNASDRWRILGDSRHRLYRSAADAVAAE